VLLHTTSENEWIDEGRKKTEKKFYSNENIEWHCIQLELKFDSIKSILNLNSNSIEKKWDAIWCKRFWKKSLEYGVEKNNLNINKYEKIPFHAFVFGSQLIRFQSFGQLMESKAT
jgi:hypothetical protein